MIEIFKTTVASDHHAANILAQLQHQFPHYQANFDLDDCDRILRISCAHEQVELSSVVLVVENWGHKAEILADEIPADTHMRLTFPVSNR
jgi:hypothetical protein